MENRSANNWYPLQVWFLTIVIIAPLETIIYNRFFTENIAPLADRYTWIILLVSFGLFFSFPVLIIYYLLFSLLIKKKIRPLVIKFILYLFSITGIYLTFALIHGSMVNLLSMIYSASVILPSFIFKIYRDNTIPNTGVNS